MVAIAALPLPLRDGSALGLGAGRKATHWPRWAGAVPEKVFDFTREECRRKSVSRKVESMLDRNALL